MGKVIKRKDNNATATSATPPTKTRKKKEANSKSREWERERRERLNLSFSDLGSLLPCNGSLAPTSKMDILQSAATFIRALQQENADLLESGGKEKSWSREVKQLRCQVKEMTGRIQQLAQLLKEAGGSMPQWVSSGQQVPPPLGKRQFLYSNRLTQDEVENTLEKLADPKKKKMRKSDPECAKKRKAKGKSSPSKNGLASSSATKKGINNQLKPPTVAQLLNVPTTTNGSTVPGLSTIPPEKPSTALDLPPGILVLQGSAAPSLAMPNAASTTADLTSGLLILRTPTSSSQHTPLASGTCIILPSSNSVNSPSYSVLSSAAQTKQPAQTTTLLSAPIMATGQPNALLQTSQPLVTTNANNMNGVSSTYVLASGSLLPIMPSSAPPTSKIKQPSKKKSPPTLIPKTLVSDTPSKCAKKVAIPVIPKRSHKKSSSSKKKATPPKNPPASKSSKTVEPKTDAVTITSEGPIQELEVVVSNVAVTSDDKGTILPETLSHQDETATCEPFKSTPDLLTSESVVNENGEDKHPGAVDNVQSSSLSPQQSSEPINKASNRSSYSIDALCKGKADTNDILSQEGTISELEPDVLSNVVSSQPEKLGSGIKKLTLPEPIQSVVVCEQSAILPMDVENDEPNQTVETSMSPENKSKSDLPEKLMADANNDILMETHRIPVKDIKETSKSDFQCSSLHEEKPTMNNQVSGPSECVSIASSQNILSTPLGAKPFYGGFESCGDMQNQDYGPVQVSPSGIIGPQPPMATSVEEPLTKESMDQYSSGQPYRTNSDLPRSEEDIGTANPIESQNVASISAALPSTFSNDIFASLNVPSGHPESISPTAAFLLAFPLVSSSSGRTNEMCPDQDMQRNESANNCNSAGSLLQLGSMEDNQPSGHTVVELNSLMHSNAHMNMQDGQPILGRQTAAVENPFKLQSKLQLSPQTPNTSIPSFSGVPGKLPDPVNKPETSHSILPIVSQTMAVNEQSSDFDAEISSIMSNANHLPSAISTNTSNKNNSQRIIPTNICRSKMEISCREDTSYMPTQQSTTHPGKSYLPMSHQQTHNACQDPALSDGMPLSQTQMSVDPLQPTYRSCNTSKKQHIIPEQSSPYPQTNNNTSSHFSSALQLQRNLMCSNNSNNNDFRQAVVSSNHMNLPQHPPQKPPPDLCVRKQPLEQQGVSQFIGKSSNNLIQSKFNSLDADGRYKSTSSADAVISQPNMMKNSIAESHVRYDRHMGEGLETSRYNIAPSTTASNQAYAYNLFNDFPTSSYLPLSSSTSSVTSDATRSSLGSFSVAHNSSNFSILSWTTLSPMSAPNSQQLPHSGVPGASCQKQGSSNYQMGQQPPTQHVSQAPQYLNSTEQQGKQVPFHQTSKFDASRSQTSYPIQVNKDPQPTPRPLVNWMTTPDVRHDSSASHNTYENSQTSCTNPVPVQKEASVNSNCGNFGSNAYYTDYSENLTHSWPASKSIPQQNNVPNPLPTLLGDLALGPTSSSAPKYYSTNKQASPRKPDKDASKRGEYGVGSSFLSVSQLVDHHGKEPRGGTSSRRASRPSNKGGTKRERRTQVSQQTLHFSEPAPTPTTYPSVSNWPAPKPSYKATPSNYSAEALIGLHTPQQQDLSHMNSSVPVDKTNPMERYPQNYPSRSHFPGETGSSYFSEAMDSSYQQTPYGSGCSSSNYQVTPSSNAYVPVPNTGQGFSAADIPGTGISTSNYTPDLGSSNFLFPASNTGMERASARSSFFPGEVSTGHVGKISSGRNNKRRAAEQQESYHEDPYLGTNHVNPHQEYNTSRPHAAPIQPPVTRCSEAPQPTFHSARGANQTTTPPSISTGGGGGTLANFNLSTIFPEINDKVPVPPLPAFVSSKNLPSSAPLLSGTSDYMLHHSNMSFNNLLGHTSSQVGIGLNQSFSAPSFPNMMPSLPFSVHEH